MSLLTPLISLKQRIILNEHFYSVFTNDESAILLEMSGTTYPTMSYKINNEGIVQLFNDIDPFKAMGPDGYHLNCL